MLTPDQKFEVAIDRALDQRRNNLSPEELEVLASLASAHRHQGFFTPEQKRLAYPILQRLRVMY